MELKLRNKQECLFDEISLGEVLLRFDPGEGRIRCSRDFHVWECGGEYNVARALKKAFSMNTAVLTALADNEMGALVRDCLMQGGVDISNVLWREYDGIGRNCRNGFVMTERGYGIRGALSFSDRGNTAASQIQPSEFDWDDIFGRQGTRWLHTGGVFAALSPTTAETVITAVQKAKEYGVTVSYDLNYRASLWHANGGLEKCREINRRIAPYIDVMIGNEEDFTACLGYEVKGNDDKFLALNLDGYRDMVQQVMADYPNMKLIATTLRTVKTATVNGWRAICYDGKTLYRSMSFDDLEVLDRVGGGDGFATGLIYGLLQGFELQRALDYGVAHGAHVQTTPGDTSMASEKEIRSIVEGKGARVVR